MRVILVAVFLFCFSVSVCFAGEGWIYSNQSLAYYSTVNQSEHSGFSWSGGSLNGRLHGYGVQRFSGSAYYEGDMNNGYREGDGTLNWGGFRYSGSWSQSRYHGTGQLITASNSYTGDFVNGKKHGYGTLTGDGTLEAGQFSYDRFIDNDQLELGYFVIGLCTRDYYTAEREAQKHKSLGLHPIVANSSNWSNLAPGWFMVVYGVLHSQEEVRALDGFKLVNGISYYIKYSGNRK